MGPQEPDPFRWLTTIGRQVLVGSVALATVTFLLLYFLGIDPPPQPFGTGRQALYSLGVGVGVGIGSFVISGWLLRRRGINLLDQDHE
jgi:hypothetical protein